MSKVKTLNTSEAVDFVNKVVEQCFREGEEGVIEYYPHLFDVTMRLYEMQMYGGIEYDGEADIMEFAYGDAYDDFVRSGVINTAQLEHLVVAIHEQIEWNKQKILKRNERYRESSPHIRLFPNQLIVSTFEICRGVPTVCLYAVYRECSTGCEGLRILD